MNKLPESTIVGIITDWDATKGGYAYAEEYEREIWVPLTSLPEAIRKDVKIGTVVTFVVEPTAYGVRLSDERKYLYPELWFLGTIVRQEMTNPGVGRGYLIIQVEPPIARALQLDSRNTIMAHSDGWSYMVACPIADDQNLVGDPVRFKLGSYKGRPRAVDVELNIDEMVDGIELTDERDYEDDLVSPLDEAML